MSVRELLHRLLDHAGDGRAMNDEILVKIDGEMRTIGGSYSDGTFILTAGAPPIH